MKCDVCGETATHNKRVCDRFAKIIEKVIREVEPDVYNKIQDCKFIYSMVKSPDTGYCERYSEWWIGIGI
jgi:hypothetical protein